MIIIEVKDFGTIELELDRKNAPISCANFVSLVKKGFYDGDGEERILTRVRF